MLFVSYTAPGVAWTHPQPCRARSISLSVRLTCGPTGNSPLLPLAASSPTLSAALSALVEAMRATVHNDAVTITTLEAENMALNR